MELFLQVGHLKIKRLPVSDWPFRFLVLQTIEVDVWLVVNELWVLFIC